MGLNLCYNRYMTTTDNPLQSIAERITKKTLALENDQNKVKNLDAQISLYEKSKTKLKSTMLEKQEEIDAMLSLQSSVKDLVAERDRLTKEIAELVDHYNSFPFRPDQPWEEKLESSNYAELTEKKFAVIDEIADLVKAANKIYYRR